MNSVLYSHASNEGNKPPMMTASSLEINRLLFKLLKLIIHWNPFLNTNCDTVASSRPLEICLTSFAFHWLCTRNNDFTMLKRIHSLLPPLVLWVSLFIGHVRIPTHFNLMSSPLHTNLVTQVFYSLRMCTTWLRHIIQVSCGRVLTLRVRNVFF